MIEDYEVEQSILVTYELETYGDYYRIVELIADESTTGTWTKVLSDLDCTHLTAKVVDNQAYSNNKGKVIIAYPAILFEYDNLPQLLSLISSTAFTIDGVKRLKITEISFPDSYLGANKGPAFGLTGVRDKLRVYDRPLSAAVLKPKIGNSSKIHAKLAYDCFVGGVDIVRDDENLADLDINPFYERVSKTMDALKEAEKVTGEKKMYIPNITARVSEMYARAKFVEELGGFGGMIDVASVGISGVQFMRDQNLDIVLYGHRIMEGSQLKEGATGFSPIVMAKIARLSGLDLIHIPSLTNGDYSEIKLINDFLSSSWSGKNKVFPVVSGGLHPGYLEELIRVSGHDQVISMGGAIFGHPDGAEAGARAFRKALEGVVAGKKLREIESPDLMKALSLWGVYGESSYSHKNLNTNIYALVKTPGTDVMVKGVRTNGAIAIREEE